MKFVSSVFPFQNVGDGANRLLGIALREQVGVLMLIAKKALGRGGFLNEGQVPGYSEARFASSRKKFIGFVPAIKAHAEAIPPEHAINSLEGRFNPGVVVVVGDG